MRYNSIVKSFLSLGAMIFTLIGTPGWSVQTSIGDTSPDRPIAREEGGGGGDRWGSDRGGERGRYGNEGWDRGRENEFHGGSEWNRGYHGGEGRGNININGEDGQDQPQVIVPDYDQQYENQLYNSYGQ